MAEISKIKIGSTTYDIKDAVARATLVGGVHYVGITTTPLTDGATTSPIMIDGESYTPKAGDIVIYESGANHLEFIWNGSATPNHWDEFGSTGELGTAAFMDYEETNLKHTHTIEHEATKAQVVYEGTPETGSVVTNVVINGEYTEAADGRIPYVSDVSANDIILNPKILVPEVGTGKYTPEGSVGLDYEETATTGGAVSYGTTNSTKTVTSNVSVANHTVSVTGGGVTITQGTVEGSTVGVSATASLAAAPAFTGTQATITPTKSSADITVSGETLTIPESVITSVGSATYTPEGTNDKPNINVSVTQGTISGSTKGVSATYTNPSVTVSKHSVTNGAITLPVLTLTAPKYQKTSSATFTGTEKDVSVVLGYDNYDLYARQDNSTEYDGAAASLRASIGFSRNLKYMAITPTKDKVALEGLSAYVSYAKAKSPTGEALNKTVKVLKTKV